MDNVQKESENTEPGATASVATPQPDTLNETQKEPAGGATTHEDKRVDIVPKPLVGEPDIEKPVAEIPVAEPVADAFPTERPSTTSVDAPEVGTFDAKNN